MLAQHPDGIFQPFERQRKHAVTDQLLNDADALAVLPYAFSELLSSYKIGLEKISTLIRYVQPHPNKIS